MMKNKTITLAVIALLIAGIIILVDFKEGFKDTGEPDDVLNFCITAEGHKILDGDILRYRERRYSENDKIIRCDDGIISTIKGGKTTTGAFKGDMFELENREIAGCAELTICNEKNLTWLYYNGVVVYDHPECEPFCGKYSLSHSDLFTKFKISDELTTYLQSFVTCEHLIEDSLFQEDKIVEKKMKMKINKDSDYGYEPFYYELKKYGFPEFQEINEGEIIFEVKTAKDIEDLYQALFDQTEWIISINLI